MKDRYWYNKIPIAEINKLIAGTGWDVRKIYVALSIQDSELNVKEHEASCEMLKYHWEDPKYKPLADKYHEIKKIRESLGGEDPPQ